MKAKIHAKMKVYEVLRRYPKATDYLLELGLCGCGFGEELGRQDMELTLEEASKEKNIDLKKLLEELNKRI
jgi:iron-sulfur cluster repair protein YtfE (RIC family)